MMQLKKFEFNHFSENTYLVYDETKEAVILDCGACSAEEQIELRNFISGNNLNIKHLLNTHLHLDHSFGNYFIYETYGVKAEYHRLEEEIIPNIKVQAQHFGIQLGGSEIPAARYLNEGDTIDFGHTTFHVLWIPGHSPGSLCFYSKENACLFSGDALFQNCIGRTDLWGGNHKDLISNIQEKLLTLPENTKVYSGHGPETTIGYEKQNNPYL